MITLHDGDGGLPFIRIENQAARAKICLLGATVLEYQPLGAEPVFGPAPTAVLSGHADPRRDSGVLAVVWAEPLTPGLPATVLCAPCYGR